MTPEEFLHYKLSLTNGCPYHDGHGKCSHPSLGGHCILDYHCPCPIFGSIIEEWQMLFEGQMVLIPITN